MVMNKKAPKAPHKVEFVDTSVVKVTSSSSGTVYTIVRDGEELICPCAGFQNRRKCSHVDAVLDAATAAAEKQSDERDTDK